MSEDYSALDNDSLRRRIAERLGWQRNGELWEVPLASGVGCFKEEITNWSEDANAALALFKVNEVQFSVGTLCGATGTYCWIASFDDYARTWEAIADTPARAICLAWLQWKDATDGTA